MMRCYDKNSSNIMSAEYTYVVQCTMFIYPTVSFLSSCVICYYLFTNPRPGIICNVYIKTMHNKKHRIYETNCLFCCLLLRIKVTHFYVSFYVMHASVSIFQCHNNQQFYKFSYYKNIHNVCIVDNGFMVFILKLPKKQRRAK